MRTFIFALLSTVTASLSGAVPQSFEQRSINAFHSREGATFQKDRVVIGSITMRFSGSSRRARLEGVGPSAPSTHFDIGRTFRQFPKVAIRGLYPGIDALLYGSGQNLEYDLLLAPGASIGPVRLAFDGARSVRIENGDLLVDTVTERLRQKLPRVFQGDGTAVIARYVLRGREIGLELGRYDRQQALTVDPELVYTRNFGGTGRDTANAIDIDAQGNIYIAGSTSSMDFPGASGLPRPSTAALLGLDDAPTPLPVGSETTVSAVGGSRDGSVLYAATPGGVYVSGDRGQSWRRGAPIPSTAVVANIAVDPLDPSILFAATNRGLYFSSDAGLHWGLHDYGLYATFDGTTNVSSVITGPDRSAMYATTLVPPGLFKSTDTGATWKALTPAYPGEPPVAYSPYSAIVAALAPNGHDLYVVNGNATLLFSNGGGDTWQPMARALFQARALLIDPTNPATLYTIAGTGLMTSTDGGLTFTNIRVNGGTPAQQIAVSGSGTLYVATSTTVYPLGGNAVATPSLHSLVAVGGRVYAGFDIPSTAYVVKLDPTGSQILYSAFFGPGNITISGLKVDGQGNCTVAGTSYSDTSFTPSGFVNTLSADGTQITYSKILSASKAVSLNGVALNASGGIYVIGQTSAPDFPTSASAVQPSLPAVSCPRQNNLFVIPNTSSYAFVAKLNGDAPWTTFLTGACGSSGQAIAVDAAGQVMVGGTTTSPDFPASPNAYQPAFPGPIDQPVPPNILAAGFLTRLSAGGDRIIASTYLGGGYITTVNALALDAAGRVTLTGSTNNIAVGSTPGAYQANPTSNCVPTINIGPGIPQSPPTDAYVLQLDPALSKAQYMTYLGGGCSDSGQGLALDHAGNVWIAGTTSSSDFPLKAPFQEQGSTFVAELSADATQLLYSSAADGTSLAIDPAGTVYVAGRGAELTKLDPSKTPTVVVDRIVPVNAFPSQLTQPFGLGPGIVPGELMRITGHGLGPAAKTNGQLDATGRLPFLLGGTRVLFDSFPAPIVSLQDTEIVCFVPFEVSQSAILVIDSDGRRSNTVGLAVGTSDPHILSIANADGSPNSADNPAQPDSVVVLYVSGLGVTNPPSADGLVNVSGRAVPVVPVSIYSGNTMVAPQFIGSAPGMVAGVIQVNVALPPTSVSSGKTNVSIGSASAVVYLAQ